MKWITLKGEPRTDSGTVKCIHLRDKGITPAVLYGHGKPNQMLQVNAKEFMKTWRQGNRLINLALKEGPEKVLIKEVQYDPVNEILLHVDFNRLAMDEKISLEVAVTLKGEPKGVKEEGGVLVQNLKQLQIKCLPGSIPEKIEVNISELAVDGMIRVKDLIVPSGVEVDADPEGVVVAIHMPKEEEVAAVGAEPGAAEPEVITAKKDEEGADEAPAKEGAPKAEAKKPAVEEKKDKK